MSFSSIFRLELPRLQFSFFVTWFTVCFGIQAAFAQPATPTVGSVTGSTINVTMPALPSGASSLTLQMRQGTSGSFANAPGINSTLQGSSSVAVKGLLSATLYNFRAAANNTGGTTYSGVASGTTAIAPNGPPEAPTVLSIATTSITVEAPTVPSGSTKLKLQYKRTREIETDYQDFALNLNSNAQTQVTGLFANTPYTFRYVSDDTTNNIGTKIDVQTLATEDTPGLPSFSDLTATSVTVKIPSLPTGATSLALQVKPPTGVYTTLQTGFTGGELFTYTYPAYNGNYYFRAITEGGRTVVFGLERSPTTLPASPAIQSGSVTSHSLVLVGLDSPFPSNWASGPYESQFVSGFATQKRIQGTGESGWNTAFFFPWLNQGPFTVDNLAPGTTYEFRYLAFGISGTAYGYIQSVTTVSGLEPGEPGSGTASNIGPRSFDITAPTLPARTDHLKLQVKQVGTSDWIDIASSVSGGATTTVSGRTASTEYEFRYLAISSNPSLTPTVSPRGSVTTTSEAPETPGVPTVGTPASTSINVTLPAIVQGLRTASLTLQYKLSTASETSYVDWTPTQRPGGTVLSVTGLTAGRSYSFRVKAHPLYGDANNVSYGVGVIGSTTAPAPSIPGAPQSVTFVDLYTVDVTAPSSLPTNTDYLSLQGLPVNQGTSEYVILDSPINAAAVTRVPGLTPGATYRFRYSASGSGGTTSATTYTEITMPSLSSGSWSAVGTLGTTIQCQGIRIPTPSTTTTVSLANAGGAVRLSSYQATDWDTRTVSATVNGNPVQFNLRASDPCIYYWNATNSLGNPAGTYIDGNRAQTTTWIPPGVGTYTITLVVTDQEEMNKATADTGTRNDGNRGTWDAPLTFQMTVNVTN